MDIKENTGILFKNDRKTEKQPTYKGELNVGGKIMNIALWDRKSAKGATYLSVVVEEKQTREAKHEPKEAPQESYSNLDDEIPF